MTPLTRAGGAPARGGSRPLFGCAGGGAAVAAGSEVRKCHHPIAEERRMQRAMIKLDGACSGQHLAHLLRSTTRT